VGERGGERRPPSAGRAWATLGLVLAAFLAVDLGLFWTPLYRTILAPDSSAWSFDYVVSYLQARPTERSRDVLVLGDSRIFSGFISFPTLNGGGRFENAAVAGTTPRCWLYLTRAIDPEANRYRAVVIPVDTYADDDSAIGSLDGDDRQFDLRYLVFATNPVDAWPIARTFSDPRVRAQAAIALLLRGPLLRDDVQALLADPLGRVAALRAVNEVPLGGGVWMPPGSFAMQKPRIESLAGLRVDFTHDRIDYPASVAPAERAEIVTQVLRRAQPSPSYARYRREWLGAIVERYRATNTPVIFVRIPTRPVHRDVPTGGPSGSLADLARVGAQFVPQSNYVALERPELFADHDHLNRLGAIRFSELLGGDVAAVLAGAPGATAQIAAQLVPRNGPHTAAPPGATRTIPGLPNLALFFGAGVPIAFQSYEYFLFFAIVAALFYSLPRRAGRIVLLCASWYFYARWNAWYVVFLLGLTASDFAVALWLERAGTSRRTLILAMGIAANLAFLGVFKYANFTTGSLAALFGLQGDPWLVNWIVPIGISFHTFQSISYLVDVYRGQIRAVRAPLDYALYIAFFPQLLAGPIVRAQRFFGELYDWRRPNADEVLRGIGEIALGLVKKAAIADQLAVVADAYFRDPAAHAGAPAAWSGILAFAFQIYFDFSGYSDIAIGSARLLGFDFPANFRRPYLATSLSDFWRRWHISLSTWLRDYVYVPLGGNRGGPLLAVRNVTVTMLLGGLWHGANWTFVAWGGYHGALLSLERILGIGRRDERTPSGFVWIVRVAATFALVCLAWVLFRAQSFGEAVVILRAAFAGGAGPWLLTPWMLAPVAIAAIVALAQERGWTPAGLRDSPLAYGGALAMLVLALELLSVSGESPPFIYFKF
jgi:alginate O-acetyltransferase complex protein AlgI